MSGNTKHICNKHPNKVACNFARYIYIYIYIYWHKCSIFKKVTAADSHRELSRIELLRSKKQIVGIGHWEGGVDHGDDRNDNKG